MGESLKKGRSTAAKYQPLLWANGALPARIAILPKHDTSPTLLREVMRERSLFAAHWSLANRSAE